MTRADLEAALRAVAAIGERICPDAPDPWRQGFDGVVEAVRNDAAGLEGAPLEGMVGHIAALTRGQVYTAASEDYRAGARRAVHELRVLLLSAAASGSR